MLNLHTFARALRLRWPWLEWKAPEKLWVGLGNPCMEEDMDLFYAATLISIGDGTTADFWHSPWLRGCRPSDISPDIFRICKRKNWTVSMAMHDEAWIRQLDFTQGLSVDHIMQFVALWTELQDVV